MDDAPLKDTPLKQVRRVAVADTLAATQPHDYADAFEVRVPADEVCPPEDWVRAGIESTPDWVGRVVGLLGMGGRAGSTTGMVGPFRIISSDANEVHLAASLSFGHVTMVGRNAEPTRRTLVTTLRFERPAIGRIIWAMLGVGHRWAASRIITSAVEPRTAA